MVLVGLASSWGWYDCSTVAVVFETIGWFVVALIAGAITRKMIKVGIWAVGFITGASIAAFLYLTFL